MSEERVARPGPRRQALESKNIAAYTCPEAQRELEAGKERYINPKIENELVEFKEEIEKNYWKSHINQTYVFKRVSPAEAAESAKMTNNTMQAKAASPEKGARRKSATMGGTVA